MNYGDVYGGLEAVDPSTRKAAARGASFLAVIRRDPFAMKGLAFGSTSQHATSALHAFTTATTYTDACAATLDMMSAEDNIDEAIQAARQFAMNTRPRALDLVVGAFRAVASVWADRSALALACLALLSLPRGSSTTASAALATLLLALLPVLVLRALAPWHYRFDNDRDIDLRCALGASDPSAAGYIACYWSHRAGLDPDATQRRLWLAQATERGRDRRVEELYAAVADGRRERWPALDAEPVKRAHCHLGRRHTRPERCQRPPGMDRPAASPRQATAPPASTSREVGYPALFCCA